MTSRVQERAMGREGEGVLRLAGAWQLTRSAEPVW